MSRPIRLALSAAALTALLLAVPAARAQQAEAKATARSANCTPGKVETLRQIAGRSDETVFKIACTGGPQKDRFILVQCRSRTCTVLR